MANLYLEYLGVGGGGSRESIRIENSVVKINYVDRDCVSFLFQVEPTVAAVHPRIGECLRIKETVLEDKEAEDLYKLIEQSDFMSLGDSYGDTSGRAYTYTIKIQLNEFEKEVTYWSSPEAEPAPQAFVDIEQKLREISDRIIDDASIDAINPNNAKVNI